MVFARIMLGKNIIEKESSFHGFRVAEFIAGGSSVFGRSSIFVWIQKYPQES
jgi:hypothetical protein